LLTNGCSNIIALSYIIYGAECRPSKVGWNFDLNL